MRSLKKILALALALLMVIGMFSGVSAVTINDYDDVDEIADQYKVAVGVLTGMGIIEGNADGTFAPENTVTRAEMTKFAYVMTLGNANISTVGTGKVFNDVAADHWAAPYIEWAYNNGLVAGHGNGDFEPEDPVKISEACALMLQVLGYGKQDEFRGDGWDSRVASEAIPKGMLAVIQNESYDFNGDCQRQEAAQIAYNTLGLDRIRYSDALGYFGTQTSLGVAVYDYVEPTADVTIVVESLVQKDGTIDFDDLTGNAAVSYTYAPSTNEVGRVANVYASTRGVIYYLDIISEDVVVDANTSDADLAEMLDDDYDIDITASANYYTDEYPNFEKNTTALDLQNRSAAASEQEAVYVIYDDDVQSVVYVNKAVYEVQLSENDDDEVVITLVDRLTLDASGNPTETKVEAKDVVNNSSADLTVYDEDDNVFYLNGQNIGGVYTFTDLETVVGTVQVYGTDTVTVGDEVYKYNTGVGAANADTNNQTEISDKLDTKAFDAIMTGANKDFTNSFDFYLSGVTGNIIAVEYSPGYKPVTGYAYIVGASAATDPLAASAYTVSLIFADGTSATVPADDDYTGIVTGTNTELVAFEYGIEGIYTITDASTATEIESVTTTALVNAYSSADFNDNDQTAFTGLTPDYIDDDTQFVYMNLSARPITTHTETGLHDSVVPVNITIWAVDSNNDNIMNYVFIEAPYEAGPEETDEYYYFASSEAGTLFVIPSGVTLYQYQAKALGATANTSFMLDYSSITAGIYTRLAGAGQQDYLVKGMDLAIGAWTKTAVFGGYTISDGTDTYNLNSATKAYDATGASISIDDLDDTTDNIYFFLDGNNVVVIVAD